MSLEVSDPKRSMLLFRDWTTPDTGKLDMLVTAQPYPSRLSLFSTTTTPPHFTFTPGAFATPACAAKYRAPAPLTLTTSEPVATSFLSPATTTGPLRHRAV